MLNAYERFAEGVLGRVITIAVFLLNKLPTKVVDGKTHFEAWYGFKPNLKNLKIFGCLCFTH